MAVITTTSVIQDINTISNSLNGNVLVKAARASLLEELDKTGMSEEERSRAYASFAQQLALGLVGQAIGLAKEMPLLIVKEAQEKLLLAALPDKIEKEASILASQDAGFLKDMFYKVLKSNSENSAMLAQAEIATPEWMTDAMKLSISKMTNGEINPS